MVGVIVTPSESFGLIGRDPGRCLSRRTYFRGGGRRQSRLGRRSTAWTLGQPIVQFPFGGCSVFISRADEVVSVRSRAILLPRRPIAIGGLKQQPVGAVRSRSSACAASDSSPTSVQVRRLLRFAARTRSRVTRPQPSQGAPLGMTIEYQRNGTANLFMMFAPLEGWRHVKCDRSSHRRGLCPGPQGTVRHTLSRTP